MELSKAMSDLLYRAEEAESNLRDELGRFPASASANPDLSMPLVNLYLQNQQGSYNPWGAYDFAACLTHDIDKVQHAETIRYITNSEKSLGKATWFFMATNPYPITRNGVRKIAEWLRDKGHEIGLHSDVGSHNNEYTLEREANRFLSVMPQAKSIRQHALMFDVPATWKLQYQYGFRHDATLGFADKAGFRAGYCLPYKPVDLVTHEIINIWEVPLIVMDVTLKYYEQLSPVNALERVKRLIDATKSVHGVFVLLWHNTFIEEEGNDWRLVYQGILDYLKKQNVYADTIEQVVKRYASNSK